MAQLSEEDLTRLQEFELFLHEIMDKASCNIARFVQRVRTEAGPDIVILVARGEEVMPLVTYMQKEQVQGFVLDKEQEPY